MSFYDISLPISNGLVVWPDDPPVSLTVARSITEGEQCNITMVQLGAHTGTHIDAPYHFLNDGGTIDAIPIETFVGPCLVVEIDAEHIIKKEDFLNYKLPWHSRVLIKTKNSNLWANYFDSFYYDYVALGITAAQYLVEMRVILVGIDYLSIETFESEGSPVHKLLLENNITILEGLNLSEVKAGEYELICLPLKLQKCEAAPARVLLRDNLTQCNKKKIKNR